MNKEEIDLLDKILSKANDWLKFAEAKNGVLIAVVCTVIFGIYKAVSDLENIHIFMVIYLISFFLFCLIALIISMLSFIPQLKPPFWLTVEERKENDNPFFFGHARKYNKCTYLKLLNISDSTLNMLLADQIIINSKIAFMKYEMFSGAAWCFLSAFLTPIGALFVMMLKE